MRRVTRPAMVSIPSTPASDRRRCGDSSNRFLSPSVSDIGFWRHPGALAQIDTARP